MIFLFVCIIFVVVFERTQCVCLFLLLCVYIADENRLFISKTLHFCTNNNLHIVVVMSTFSFILLLFDGIRGLCVWISSIFFS